MGIAGIAEKLAEELVAGLGLGDAFHDDSRGIEVLAGGKICEECVEIAGVAVRDDFGAEEDADGIGAEEFELSPEGVFFGEVGLDDDGRLAEGEGLGFGGGAVADLRDGAGEPARVFALLEEDEGELCRLGRGFRRRFRFLQKGLGLGVQPVHGLRGG